MTILVVILHLVAWVARLQFVVVFVESIFREFRARKIANSHRSDGRGVNNMSLVTPLSATHFPRVRLLGLKPQAAWSSIFVEVL